MSVLQETIEKMVAPNKGILAADESTSTAGKRLESIGVDNTEENRRAYREMLITTEGAEKYISGIILYEETLYQKTADGKPFVDILNEKGIVPGIKVDTGLCPIGGVNQENTTQGFDNLSERCAQYFKDGARFTKWRSAFEIDPANGLPSELAIEENARVQARYAAIAQENNLVPIVEPEVMMTGNFTMEQYADVTARVLNRLFERLAEYGVDLATTILKVNMIVPATEGGETATPEEVAEKTYAVLKAEVPADIPAIVFLSGGQTEQEALDNLAAINAHVDNDTSWRMSFSYGRALQATALKTWGGKAENAAAASQAYLEQAQKLGAVVK